MPDRLEVERLLRELYAARLGGDLEALCRTFAKDARLDIAGTSYATPMAIKAAGLGEIRSWLALLVKTFQLGDQEILSMIIDGEAAAVHWRARIRSKITGATVLTELIDVVRVREGRIASYTEFFVPREVSAMSVRSEVLSQFKQVAQEQNKKLAALSDDLPLSESGLDSLCFAIIVSRLEDALGVDPFTSTEQTEFPVTLADFIRFYEDAAK